MSCIVGCRGTETYNYHTVECPRRTGVDVIFMLTKTANELIGKRARVLRNPEHPELERQIGTVDQIVLNGNGGTVRLLIAGRPILHEMSLDAIEYCNCGEGGGCPLCAEKPA